MLKLTTDRQTNKQTNKQTWQKQYAPDHLIRGIKIAHLPVAIFPKINTRHKNISLHGNWHTKSLGQQYVHVYIEIYFHNNYEWERNDAGYLHSECISLFLTVHPLQINKSNGPFSPEQTQNQYFPSRMIDDQQRTKCPSKAWGSLLGMTSPTLYCSYMGKDYSLH